MLEREGHALSNMDYNIFQQPTANPMGDPLALLTMMAPLLGQSGGGEAGFNDLNFIIKMLSGGNIADVLGMGPRPDLVAQPERRENYSASWLRDSEIGESILQSLFGQGEFSEKRQSPQEVLSRLKTAVETSPEVREWVENATDSDKTTGEINWNNMRSLIQNVVEEQSKIDQEFRDAEREFIAQQASQPRYGYEQPDPEPAIQRALADVDPEAVQRKMMEDYAKNFPSNQSAKASQTSQAPTVSGGADVASSAAVKPVSRGRGAREARARREREASRPPKVDRSGRSRSQIRRGGGSGIKSSAVANALTLEPSQTGSTFDPVRQEEIRQRALASNYQTAESGIRALENERSRNSAPVATPDTQRVMDLLPLLMMLRGVGGK
jgi:hypothetical protein